MDIRCPVDSLEMLGPLRFFMLLAGFLCVGLGVVGIFLPVLPTTPFLLLAAFLFSRSSRRFHDWLLSNRLFGGYIRRYREGPSMTRWHKILTLLFLWAGITASATFGVHVWWARLLLALVAVGVTVHVLWLKTADS